MSDSNGQLASDSLPVLLQSSRALLSDQVLTVNSHTVLGRFVRNALTETALHKSLLADHHLVFWVFMLILASIRWQRFIQIPRARQSERSFEAHVSSGISVKVPYKKVKNHHWEKSQDLTEARKNTCGQQESLQSAQ